MVYSIKMVYTMVYHMAQQQVKRHTMVNIMLYNIKKTIYHGITYVIYHTIEGYTMV